MTFAQLAELGSSPGDAPGTRTVVKRGRLGAMTRERGDIVRVTGFAVNAIDTTGGSMRDS